MVEARQIRRGEKTSSQTPLLSSQRLTSALFFTAFGLLLVFICFFGQSAAGPRIIQNQMASFRVQAEISFDYRSDLLTKKLIEERSAMVAPVYKLDMSPYERFSKRIKDLLARLAEFETNSLGLETTQRLAAAKMLVDEFNQQSGFRVDAGDIAVLLEKTEEPQRSILFNDGLLALREFYRGGLLDSNRLGVENPAGEPFFLSLNTDEPNNGLRVYTISEASRLLRINLTSLRLDEDVMRSLLRILRAGLHPNMEPDQKKTEAKRQAVVSNVEPVTITVEQGESIIEPHTRITAEDLEKYNAYRKALAKQKEYGLGFNERLIEQLIMTFAILAVTAIAVSMGKPHLDRSARRIIVFSLLLVANLAFMRGILALGDTALSTSFPGFNMVLPYLLPVALSSILATILIGTSPAILIALLSAIFASLMQANSYEVLVTSLISSLTAVFHCRDIRLRAKVVRAGIYSGLATALAVVFFGLFDELSGATIIQQMLAAVLTGVLTGTLAIGLLPVIENMFKFTTEITLLELTDFNHPLLRRMQMVAPGSYHHSLMVANLAERAAAEIGANTLVCRVGALFHDIGKMVKPEYFIENQRDGYNPHVEKNPSMSALVIKSHVKEGLTMARQSKLPQVVEDIIEQHHGQSLIWYFYHAACKKKEAENEGDPNAENSVEESTFRYDGPKPQFKEAGIIMLTDAVEAASRSLSKVTPNSIEELVDGIFANFMKDGQLDECPITMREIETVRASLVFALINTLHQRTKYPEKATSDDGKHKQEESQVNDSGKAGRRQTVLTAKEPDDDEENTENEQVI